MNQRQLEDRIEAIVKRVQELNDLLRLAHKYAADDAQSSLHKCRNGLEHSVKAILAKYNISFPEGSTLNDQIKLLKESGYVPDHIIATMHSIRVMANLANHNKKVTSGSALSALNGLCDILEWQNEIAAPKQPKKEEEKNSATWIFGMAAATVLAGALLLYLTRPVSEKDVESFVLEFQDVATSNKINTLMNYYDEGINWFGKIKSKEEVKVEWRKFIEKWPTRIYSIDDPIEVEVLGEQSFRVHYNETYTAKAYGKEDSKGVWRTTLLISKVNGKLKISSIDGYHVSKNFTPNNAEAFARAFQSACTTNNIEEATSFYAKNAVCYKKPRTLKEIRMNWSNFVNDWPIRDYTITDPIEVKTLGNNSFRVTYRENFNAEKEDGTTSKGIWQTILTLKEVKDSLRITEIDGERIMKQG